ncbi:MAG: transcriptional repressor, partial [Anaeroplasmataceae bacterium]|nr:transcriptional repressor [Anaeroplasmataceae bacterium]
VLEEFRGQMNKATIYRKLNALEEQKILRKNYNMEKKCYEYQYCPECKNHLHLICKSCGKILHLNCESAKTFVQHISLEHQFLLDQESTMILGICKECSSHA